MEVLDVFCLPSEYHVSGHGWREEKKKTKQQLRTGLYRNRHDNLQLFTKCQFNYKVTI